MRGRGVVFAAPWRAELEPVEIDPHDLAPGEALVRADCSIVSAGTEGAFFTGLMLETPSIYRTLYGTRALTYPIRPGYGHVGQVVAVGPAVEHLEPGQRVLSFSRHASIVRCNAARFALPVPAAADAHRALFTRMAGVAVSALRASSAGAGDKVAVVGLGLVGNLAAQLLQLAGCDVLAFDVSPRRLDTAAACGIATVANASVCDPIQTTREWVGARDDRGGARIVVEATGRSDLVAQAVEMTGSHGETVLLGSPRAPFAADLTPMLARIHLLGIRLVGALEWLYPIPEDTTGARHTITANYRQLLGWITAGRLVVGPLLTHVLRPERCQEAYDGLTRHQDTYLGVIFDWTGDTSSG